MSRAWCIRQDCDFDVRGSAEVVDRAAEDHSGSSRRKSSRNPGHPVVTSRTGVIADDE